MKHILFRGKRKDNGKWVKGYIGEAYDGKRNVLMISRPSKEHLAGSTCDEIIPETVGQYTGLKDKNGKMIFEGDIVKHETGGPFIFDYGIIIWDDEECCFCRTSKDFHGKDTVKIGAACIYEVLGNVHDNPGQSSWVRNKGVL